MTPTETLLQALREHGCDPRKVGPGLWLATCPSCREAGHFGLLEVRQAPGGHIDLECKTTQSLQEEQ